MVDGTYIYRKDTHTGQYSHFSSFDPFYRKTAWVKSLYHGAFKICSTKTHLTIIEIIKSFMSWNGYPKCIQNVLLKTLKTKYFDSTISIAVNQDTDGSLCKIWIRIPYLGSRGDFLLKSCLNKVHFFLSLLNLSLFMTLKNFHILFPTKTNFLLYVAVMFYMRWCAQDVAKHISASHKDAFLYV